MVQKYIWDESISTGVMEIDLQHKQFFAVLHDFADELEQGAGAVGLKKLLVFLKYYGEWNFGWEEHCAASHQCPIADTNIHAHQKYMETVNTLITQCSHEIPTEALANSAYEMLTDWLVNHIIKIDKQIGSHIHQCRKNGG